MDKKIIASTEIRRALEEKFECSQTTISLALNFKRNNMLARRIRSYAVNTLKATPLV